MLYYFLLYYQHFLNSFSFLFINLIFLISFLFVLFIFMIFVYFFFFLQIFTTTILPTPNVNSTTPPTTIT